MNSALIDTDNGLQVRTGAARAAHANREHHQPDGIVPAGFNSFEISESRPLSRAKPWKPSKLAAAMGVHPRTVKNRIYAGHLPAVPLGFNRYVIPAHVAIHCLRFGLNAFAKPL